MTTDELIESYRKLLIIQYESLPNASRTIESTVAAIIQDQIYTQVRDGFNFSISPIGLQNDSARGVQLDAVASYRGASRLIYGIDLSRSYFEMPTYGDSGADTAPGFALYGQSPILDLWITYENAQQPLYALTDDELYRLTQFLAMTQSTLLSAGNVDAILFDFFANNVGYIEGPMSLVYIDLISDTDTLFTIVNATGNLPRPAGVKVTAIRSETLSGFFGFSLYGVTPDPDFVGFGFYGSPQLGSFVRYP